MVLDFVILCLSKYFAGTLIEDVFFSKNSLKRLSTRTELSAVINIFNSASFRALPTSRSILVGYFFGLGGKKHAGA